MKRFLLAFLLAMLLVALITTPAVAAKVVSAEPLPPAGIPILLPAMWPPGMWGYGEGSGDEPGANVLVYEALGPDDAWEYVEGSNCAVPYRAVPADEEVILCIGWIGSSYGQVRNLPQAMDTSFRIVSLDNEGRVAENGPSWTYTPEQTAPYWTGPTAWDEWWAAWFNYLWASPGLLTEENPFVLFNPHTAAGSYWNHLYFPAGPFPAGHYRLYWSMLQVRTIVDMTTVVPEMGYWPFAVFKPWDGFMTVVDAEWDFWVE